MDARVERLLTPEVRGMMLSAGIKSPLRRERSRPMAEGPQAVRTIDTPPQHSTQLVRVVAACALIAVFPSTWSHPPTAGETSVLPAAGVDSWLRLLITVGAGLVGANLLMAASPRLSSVNKRRALAAVGVSLYAGAWYAIGSDGGEDANIGFGLITLCAPVVLIACALLARGSCSLTSWGIGLMVGGMFVPFIPFVAIAGWIMCLVEWRRASNNGVENTAAKVAGLVGVGLWVVAIAVEVVIGIS
jgi:hypothetical protein